MLAAAKQGFNEENSLQVNKILIGFLTSQDAFYKLLHESNINVLIIYLLNKIYFKHFCLSSN